MRIMIKGGVWKNIEDEILKAAVMKYGLNQWSRISSLLVRKSAKQCKSRWYEWLDPSIKKTEWSREEEEKLLHLAKIFPTQWRTIAPILGRTPAQCIQHYEQLLEEASGVLIEEAADPRKLKPGEIDPAPETKPAKSDPVDMDEDEKEMLQEARARLSNAKGKKAKRKVREKQLEEGRRLATVQRKRELRAAGIDMELKKRVKHKMREMEYNGDMPFEHPELEGPFVGDLVERPRLDQLMISAQRYEANVRDETEAKWKAVDKRKMQKLKELNLPVAIRKINAANDSAVTVQRTPLLLPAPQMTETQLNELCKMSGPQPEGGASDLLLPHKGEFLVDPTEVATKGDDFIQNEAYNAYLMSRMTTPLVGGASVPVSWERSERVKTPNVLVESLKEPQETPVAQGSVREVFTHMPLPCNEYELEPPEPFREDTEESEEELLEFIDSKGPGHRSSVVLLGLPRPLAVNPKQYTNELDLLREEVLGLVLYDMHEFPVQNAKIPVCCPDREEVPEEYLARAKQLILAETVEAGEIGVLEDSLFNAEWDKREFVVTELCGELEEQQGQIGSDPEHIELAKHIDKLRKRRRKIALLKEVYEQLATQEARALETRTQTLSALLRTQQALAESLDGSLISLPRELDAWSWLKASNSQ